MYGSSGTIFVDNYGNDARYTVGDGWIEVTPTRKIYKSCIKAGYQQVCLKAF